MTAQPSQRLIIAHDRGLVALSRFVRHRSGGWERTSSTAPTMLEKLPLSQAEIVESLLLHPDFGDLLRSGSSELQVIFNNVDGKALSFEGLGVVPESLPRSVALFQEAQRQQVFPPARAGAVCYVLSVELHGLSVTRLVAGQDRWQVESEKDLGSPLDDEAPGHDPVDQVADHLAEASGIARAEFNRVQVREIIARQLEAYEREASSPQFGQIRELEFVIPPLSPLGRIEFNLAVATLFPAVGEKLRRHVRDLRAQLTLRDTVIVAGRAVTFAWVKEILHGELGDRAATLEAPEFAAVRGGSLGTGELPRKPETFKAGPGQLEITDGKVSAVLAMDLTQTSRFRSKGALTAYTTSGDHLIFNLTFVWTWPSGEVERRQLTLSSALPRWIQTSSISKGTGHMQVKMSEFEVTGSPEAIISIKLNHPFESNVYLWDLNA